MNPKALFVLSVIIFVSSVASAEQCNCDLYKPDKLTINTQITSASPSVTATCPPFKGVVSVWCLSSWPIIDDNVSDGGRVIDPRKARCTWTNKKGGEVVPMNVSVSIVCTEMNWVTPNYWTR